VEANGLKLTIASDNFKGDAKLKGGNPATLTGTVRRVGSSLDEVSPISIADGYTAMRVTVAKKSLRPARLAKIPAPHVTAKAGSTRSTRLCRLATGESNSGEECCAPSAWVGSRTRTLMKSDGK
jgi:hypothetical protein